MTFTIQRAAPSDLADEMLAAVARAERAEAIAERARDDMKFANGLRDTAIKQRDQLAELLAQVRTFHDSWGDTEGADALALWEDLDRILNPKDT